MAPGNPCHFVEIGKGCKIYETRPQNPCRQFTCLWLTDNQVPDYLRPANSGIVATVKKIENIEYLYATSTGKEMSEIHLSWIISYGTRNFGNIMWRLSGQELFYLGSQAFLEAIERWLASE
jgi:hypothetical protein